MNKLLVAAVILVVAKDAVPYGLDAWEARRFEQRRQRFMALKDREIACLDQLIKSGLPKREEVQPAIERCKRLAVDPDTGSYATFP